MIHLRRGGILGAFLTLGLATPSWAQEASHDDHQTYHHELDEEHALHHQELEEEQRQAGQEEAWRHHWQHASGDGRGLSHWLYHRRAERRRRLSEARARREHAASHAEMGAEHDVHHQPVDVYAPMRYWILPRDYRLRPFGW